MTFAESFLETLTKLAGAIKFPGPSGKRGDATRMTVYKLKPGQAGGAAGPTQPQIDLRPPAMPDNAVEDQIAAVNKASGRTNPGAFRATPVARPLGEDDD